MNLLRSIFDAKATDNSEPTVESGMVDSRYIKQTSGKPDIGKTQQTINKNLEKRITQISKAKSQALNVITTKPTNIQKQIDNLIKLVPTNKEDQFYETIISHVSNALVEVLQNTDDNVVEYALNKINNLPNKNELIKHIINYIQPEAQNQPQFTAQIKLLCKIYNFTNAQQTKQEETLLEKIRKATEKACAVITHSTDKKTAIVLTNAITTAYNTVAQDSEAKIIISSKLQLITTNALEKITSAQTPEEIATQIEILNKIHYNAIQGHTKNSNEKAYGDALYKQISTDLQGADTSIGNKITLSTDSNTIVTQYQMLLAMLKTNNPTAQQAIKENLTTTIKNRCNQIVASTDYNTIATHINILDSIAHISSQTINFAQEVNQSLTTAINNICQKIKNAQNVNELIAALTTLNTIHQNTKNQEIQNYIKSQATTEVLNLARNISTIQPVQTRLNLANYILNNLSRSGQTNTCTLKHMFNFDEKNRYVLYCEFNSVPSSIETAIQQSTTIDLETIEDYFSILKTMYSLIPSQNTFVQQTFRTATIAPIADVIVTQLPKCQTKEDVHKLLDIACRMNVKAGYTTKIGDSASSLLATIQTTIQGIFEKIKTTTNSTEIAQHLRTLQLLSQFTPDYNSNYTEINNINNRIKQTIATELINGITQMSADTIHKNKESVQSLINFILLPKTQIIIDKKDQTAKQNLQTVQYTNAILKYNYSLIFTTIQKYDPVVVFYRNNKQILNQDLNEQEKLIATLFNEAKEQHQLQLQQLNKKRKELSVKEVHFVELQDEDNQTKQIAARYSKHKAKDIYTIKQNGKVMQESKTRSNSIKPPKKISDLKSMQMKLPKK